MLRNTSRTTKISFFLCHTWRKKSGKQAQSKFHLSSYKNIYVTSIVQNKLIGVRYTLKCLFIKCHIEGIEKSQKQIRSGSSFVTFCSHWRWNAGWNIYSFEMNWCTNNFDNNNWLTRIDFLRNPKHHMLSWCNVSCTSYNSHIILIRSLVHPLCVLRLG